MTKVEARPIFVTPPTEDGPLYPPGEIPVRHDLTNDGMALGQQVIIMGVISNFRAEPVESARIEIWQADDSGYYDHPRARGEDAMDEYWKISVDDLDENFGYFGAVVTGPDGVYWFRTIIPRWYHVFGTDRAAHIHVKLRSLDNGVLTTELYFSRDEDLRFQGLDRVYNSRRQQPDLFVELARPDERLPGVPLVTGVQYVKKDFSFL